MAARVAQSVEQRTENPCVAGSIPALGTVSCVVGFVLSFVLSYSSLESLLDTVHSLKVLQKVFCP